MTFKIIHVGGYFLRIEFFKIIKYRQQKILQKFYSKLICFICPIWILKYSPQYILSSTSIHCRSPTLKSTFIPQHLKGVFANQKRFFIALSLYPLSFFANTPFKESDKHLFVTKTCRFTSLIQNKVKSGQTIVTFRSIYKILKTPVLTENIFLWF